MKSGRKSRTRRIPTPHHRPLDHSAVRAGLVAGDRSRGDSPGHRRQVPAAVHAGCLSGLHGLHDIQDGSVGVSRRAGTARQAQVAMAVCGEPRYVGAYRTALAAVHLHLQAGSVETCQLMTAPLRNTEYSPAHLATRL